MFITISSCSDDEDKDKSPQGFTLLSDDFEMNGKIPEFLTCNGPGQPPELHWENPPEGTISFAITMDDPDFEDGFNHWILFNISDDTRRIARGSTGGEKPSGSTEGTNDAIQLTYLSPCPPGGESHKFTFRLFALDAEMSLDSSIRIDEFMDSIQPNILEQTTLIGVYN